MLAILLIIFLIQLFYYLSYYSKPVSYLQKRKDSGERTETYKPSVSVIIVAKDEVGSLERNLPLILQQDYPDYEVIIVNIGFTDETDMLLKSFQLQHKHLYQTFLPERTLDSEASRKTMALTIGIKAATKDVLLFSKADSTPLTNRWIASLMEEMGQKDIVLGYREVRKSTGFLNRLSRFDNLLYSLQYFSLALKNKPVTGTYYNVAYKKNLFFDNNGFSSFLNYKYPEGVFLNYIMNKSNTAISLSQDSFVSSRINSLYAWREMRFSYLKIKKHFRNFRFYSSIFSLETLTRYLFYLALAFIIVFCIITSNWDTLIIAGLIFLCKTAVQLKILNKSAKHFMAGKFYFSFIPSELLQPVYNLYFRIQSRKK